ncbi:DUF4190 domain-containing protein [Glycomyces tritici]|uniref:DUF4190 domain-containing protein n=1 Tax=Glycomyces tritici TaxID=2665176 RepID=A0ABT7YP70_9ACTN|nr:DUF4190 domain-containing protein [Glycomyces tritici]MDN3240048.1 DUF4190 domain-containing protein [Glycomyces tritici]
MTYPPPPPPDQSGQGGFQYDPYNSQPGSQPQNPSQPQQPGYSQPSQPQQPGYGPAPQLPPQAPGYPPAYGAPGYGPQLPKGQAIASMVTGIISVAGLCIPYINFASLVLGIIAAVLGGVALKKINAGQAAGKGQAITGLVLGIIVCALAVIGIIMFASGMAMLGGSASMM